MVVILELGEWEKVHPVILSLIDEKAEVLFQFLIDSLGLAIPLWVEGGRRSKFDAEHAVKLMSELGNKLWSSVRYDSAGQSMVSPDMLEEETGSSSSGDGGQSGDEVRSLGDRVYYYHYCIMTGRLRQFHYEVHADGVPGRIWNWERVKLSYRAMPLDLGSEAQTAHSDILPYVPRHLRPPVVA